MLFGFILANLIHWYAFSVPLVPSNYFKIVNPTYIHHIVSPLLSFLVELDYLFSSTSTSHHIPNGCKITSQGLNKCWTSAPSPQMTTGICISVQFTRNDLARLSIITRSRKHNTNRIRVFHESRIIIYGVFNTTHNRETLSGRVWVSRRVEGYG